MQNRIIVRVFEVDQQDSSFYSVMGEHFASLDHKKEMGGWQIYNKPESIWFLIYENDILVGFCSVFEEKNLDNFMILKPFRRRELSKILLGKSLEFFTNRRIRALTNNPYMIKNFENKGFSKVARRGSYYVYECS